MSRLSEYIRRHQRGAVDVQVLPWDIESVVSLQASWSLPTTYARHAGLEHDLLAAMLDKGTLKQDKRSISDTLERVGASISFSSGSSKMHVAARCLAPDLSLVLRLIREQVEEPALDARELELLKGRIQAQLRRQRSDPGAVCRNEMSRRLFGPDHPTRELAFKEAETVLAGLDVDAMRAHHAAPSGWEGLRLALVGDVAGIDPAGIAEALVIHEGHEDTFRFRGAELLLGGPPSEQFINIPDRSNLNVQMGHAVDLPAVHPDYLPLWVAVFILGGNFSSRLMSTVRDERGLTYGIRSSLGHAGRHFGGAWTTSVTLSQDRLAEGIQATREVVEHFVSDGVSAPELAERVQTLVGSYQVELATTSGVASRLMHTMSRGREPEYIDEHPDILRGLTTAQVNASVRRWLDVSRLSLVGAGSLPSD